MEMTSGVRPMGKARSEIRLAGVCVMAAGCFFVSRCALLDGMFPAGIALAAALISRNAIYVYLLPVSLLGLLSCVGQGDLIWGDLAAIAVCGIFFRGTGRIRFSLWHKSAIAAAICITSNCFYYVGARILYRLSMENLWLEAMLVAALCPCFDWFAGLAEKEKRNFPMEAGIAAAAALFFLSLLGTGLDLLILPVGMAAILYLGYTEGVIGGLVSGLVGGLVLLFGGGGAAMVLALALAGLVSGFSKGQNRIAAGICFTAAAAVPGLLDLGVPPEVPLYGAVSGAACFVLIPGKWLRRSGLWLSRFLQSDRHCEAQHRATAANLLLRQKKEFDHLEALYADPDHRSAVLSYQFRGMAQMIDRLIHRLEYPVKQRACRFRVQTAASGYARGWDVSGDSYACEALEDGTVAMIISDGMGKGAAAAAESSLVVATIASLLKGGVEIELILKILNSIVLLNRDAEILSTVDLGILDRNTGKMKFYKIGAAPTLIKRHNGVELIRTEAMPIGILDGLDISHVAVTLHPGDQVIMMSDGIMDSCREDLNMEWMKAAIAEIRSKDPQTMCDLLLNRAVRNYGTMEKDDLTLLAVRVS